MSVIMPVHNGARYLRESLQSALDQQYPALEIIVVDDGSTDETPSILRDFGTRITSIRQKNAGAAVARNAAMRMARGEFLAFLDADDLWLAHKLSLQTDYLAAHPEIALVASRWQTRAEAGNGSERGAPSDAAAMSIDRGHSGWLYTELLIDCVIHTTTVVMRRALVDKIGLFDPSLRRGQDYDYWLKASRATEIHTLNAELSVYRLHTANSTWQPQSVNYGAIVVQRALDQWGRRGPDGRLAPLRKVRRRLSELWFAFGYEHLKRGKLPIAFDAALRSLIAWPLYPKPWRLLTACATGPLRRR